MLPPKQRRWRSDAARALVHRSGAQRVLGVVLGLVLLTAVLFWIAGMWQHHDSMHGLSLTDAQKTYLSTRRFVFAANFHNNGAVLRAMTSEYLALFTLLGPANVFVAIFENGTRLAGCHVMWHVGVIGSCDVGITLSVERVCIHVVFPEFWRLCANLHECVAVLSSSSGSDDDTKAQLEAFAAALSAQHIAHHIILSNLQTWNHNNKDAPMSDRIAFMARVRNAALLPILTPISTDPNAMSDAAAVLAHDARLTLARRLRQEADVREAVAHKSRVAGVDGHSHVIPPDRPITGRGGRTSIPSQAEAEATTVESLPELTQWLRQEAHQVFSNIAPTGLDAFHAAAAFGAGRVTTTPRGAFIIDSTAHAEI
jgi:hypothetical protein